jgi:ABC-type Fe3+-hydroxamate transport system substrate-binding protein
MRFSKFTYSSLVFFLIALVLVGCSTQQPETTPEIETVTETEAAPLTAEPTEIPIPSAEKGVLTGSLVQKGVDGNPDKPYAGIRLFLGSLLVADDGKSTLARVNSLEAPQTITDADGRFVFKDLEPETYILVLQAPPNQLIKLNDPDTGLDMMIEIAGGEITDIGPQYHDLPWFTIPTP